MWVVRLKIRHDCTIGSRCRKFNCTAYSISINSWAENNYEYTIQRHIIEGEEKNILKFLNDLKKDKRIKKLEISKNTVFFIEKRFNEKIPGSFYNPKMFYIKPIFVDKDGFEYWELGSLEKRILTDFVKGLTKQKEMELKIEKVEEVKLSNIYFPRLLPKLSEKQRRAFELAVENNYYKFPRKIGLKGLANAMNVSVSTFQEHLRKAEEKIMPSIKP